MSYRVFNHDEHDSPVALNTGWTPVLRGDIYCSPACGGLCKKADYDRAVQQANSIAALLGSGWEPEVWENLGWYFSVKKGAAEVHWENHGGDTPYTASICVSTDGLPDEQFSARAADPRQAMQQALAFVEARVARLKNVLVSAAIEPLQLQ